MQGSENSVLVLVPYKKKSDFSENFDSGTIFLTFFFHETLCIEVRPHMCGDSECGNR
jgi:hypothetical protein